MKDNEKLRMDYISMKEKCINLEIKHSALKTVIEADILNLSSAFKL